MKLLVHLNQKERGLNNKKAENCRRRVLNPNRQIEKDSQKKLVK